MDALMAVVLNININKKKKPTALNIFTKAVCVLVEAVFGLFCINVGLKVTNFCTFTQYYSCWL